MTSVFLTSLAAIPLLAAPHWALSPEAPRSAAAPHATERYDAHVTIDTAGLRDGLPENEVAQQQQLFEQRLPTAFIGGTHLSEEASDDVAEVKFIVGWANFEEFRYSVTVEVTTPDGEQQKTSFTFRGIEEDLVGRMKEEVPTVLTWLEKQDAEEGPSGAPPSPLPQEGTEGPEEHPPPPPNEGRGLLWSGIGLTAVGAALLPTGAVLHVQTQEEQDGLGPDSIVTKRRHPKALTSTLMGVGAAALGAGVVLIIVGAKKRQGSKTTRLGLDASRSHAGLTLHGRF